MSEKITFILLATNDKNIGMIYSMIHQGSDVVSRKSMKIKIPYKFWDTKIHRVKKNYHDAERINDNIESLIKEFKRSNLNIPNGEDSQCVLEYMRKFTLKKRNDKMMPESTYKKYDTIIKNFEQIIYKVFKMDSLPFGSLRNKDFIYELKLEIRKNCKGGNRLKKNKSWFNYMSVFGTFVNHWNTVSGTQYPINTRIFTAEIPNDQQKFASILTHQELNKVEEFNPLGYKNGESQLLAKNIFIFQYYTGGIRIQDALTLTNKQIKSEGIEIKIKKTKQAELFPFCYEQVISLKNYYLNEYENSVHNIKLGNISLSANTIISLNNMEGIGTLNDLGLQELKSILNKVITNKKKQPELVQFIEPISEAIDVLKEEITNHFFSLLKMKPQNFLFPKLSWGDFKMVFGSSEIGDLDSKQGYIIHRATTSHNSSLKTIAKHLDLERLSGHTPRHTLANHLLNDDHSVEEIQKVLVHSDPKTTEIYLNERHGNLNVNKTMIQTHKKRRDLKQKFSERG
jgi:integrase